jgi:hypothetical protein
MMTNEQEPEMESTVTEPVSEEAEVETVQEPVVQAQLTADDFDTEEEDDDDEPE